MIYFSSRIFHPKAWNRRSEISVYSPVIVGKKRDGIDRVIAVGKQYKRNIKTVMENDHQSVRHVVFITSFWKKAICFLYCIDLTNMLVICFGHKYIHSRSAIGCGVSNVSFIPFSFLVFGILHSICLPFARQDGKNEKKITLLMWPKY